MSLLTGLEVVQTIALGCHSFHQSLLDKKKEKNEYTTTHKDGTRRELTFRDFRENKNELCAKLLLSFHGKTELYGKLLI